VCTLLLQRRCRALADTKKTVLVLRDQPGRSASIQFLQCRASLARAAGIGSDIPRRAPRFAGWKGGGGP
jgi:hypothetical protein